MTRNNFVFFWSGPFSQWYQHDMTIDGVKYNCAEQFMMAMKATHFKDEEALEKIMTTKDPRKQKAIGRTIKGFNAEVWSKVAKAYVYIGNLEKFSDPTLKKVILNTLDKEIVEASPYDTIWGIGMTEYHKDILDKTKWRGTNWLGEVLMDVRRELNDRP